VLEDERDAVGLRVDRPEEVGVRDLGERALGERAVLAKLPERVGEAGPCRRRQRRPFASRNF
jgi:hypothetical protein